MKKYKRNNCKLLFYIITLFLFLLFPTNTKNIQSVMAQSIRYSIESIDNQKLQCFYTDSSGTKSKVTNQFLAIQKSGDSYIVTTQNASGSTIYQFDAQGIGQKYTKTGFVKVSYENSKKNLYIKNGMLYTGFYTKGSDRYYCVKGVRIKGWKKINQKYYYFNNKYKLQKNAIVGSKTNGYYYVDKTGIRITTPEIKYAVTFVLKHSNSKASKERRLKECFQALCQYRYRRFSGDTPSASKMASYANYMFTNKFGNCYRYASAMAYIARVLGFNSRVAVGGVTARASGSLLPHGWCEVQSDSTWKMIDCSMQNAHRDKSLFLITRKNYPFRKRCDKVYTLNAKNGKIVWR